MLREHKLIKRETSAKVFFNHISVQVSILCPIPLIMLPSLLIFIKFATLMIVTRKKLLSIYCNDHEIVCVTVQVFVIKTISTPSFFLGIPSNESVSNLKLG